jgi:hypothetical protein
MLSHYTIAATAHLGVPRNLGTVPGATVLFVVG